MNRANRAVGAPDSVWGGEAGAEAKLQTKLSYPPRMRPKNCPAFLEGEGADGG